MRWYTVSLAAAHSAFLCICICTDLHWHGHCLAAGATTASVCTQCLAGSYSTAAGGRCKIRQGRAAHVLGEWQDSGPPGGGKRSAAWVRRMVVVVRWRESRTTAPALLGLKFAQTRDSSCGATRPSSLAAGASACTPCSTGSYSGTAGEMQGRAGDQAERGWTVAKRCMGVYCLHALLSGLLRLACV